MKILLIEDNPSIVKGLVFSLENAGYDVLEATNVADAKVLLNTTSIDLCIVDITLPDGDGVSLYEDNIKERDIMTIFLTAKDDEETVVKCLTLGAEDYITKPFRAKELLVRIEKIFMRKNKNTIVSVADLTFDMDKMVVYKRGDIVELTSLELKILHLLFLNLNKVVRRNTIIEKIWEWTGNDIEDNTVTVYLKRIREKIGNDLIITIKGIGYRIDADEKCR